MYRRFVPIDMCPLDRMDDVLPTEPASPQSASPRLQGGLRRNDARVGDALDRLPSHQSPERTITPFHAMWKLISLEQ